jgi:hypothetical protein
MTQQTGRVLVDDRLTVSARVPPSGDEYRAARSVVVGAVSVVRG